MSRRIRKSLASFMVSDDIAGEGVVTTEEDVKDAEKENNTPPVKEKKKKGQKALYRKRAQEKLAEIEGKPDFNEKLKELINKLRC